MCVCCINSVCVCVLCAVCCVSVLLTLLLCMCVLCVFYHGEPTPLQLQISSPPAYTRDSDSPCCNCAPKAAQLHTDNPTASIDSHRMETHIDSRGKAVNKSQRKLTPTHIGLAPDSHRLTPTGGCRWQPQRARAGAGAGGRGGGSGRGGAGPGEQVGALAAGKDPAGPCSPFVLCPTCIPYLRHTSFCTRAPPLCLMHADTHSCRSTLPVIGRGCEMLGVICCLVTEEMINPV